jgi:hypothetical protein
MTFGDGTFGQGTFGDPSPGPEPFELRPGTPVRVRARHVSSGVTYPVWRGFLEEISESFSPSETPTASLACQDGYAQVAHINLPERDPVGAGETSDQRVHRLLDLAEWPQDRRDIDPGQVTVQATNLARNLVDDLGITADSEGGAVFSAKDGKFTFRNRDWFRLAPYATAVQATVGGDGEDVCASGYEIVRAGSDIVNDVQFARAEGTMQRLTDETSVGKFRRRTYERSDFVCEHDEQVQVLAGRVLTSRAPGRVRMTSVTITPHSSDDYRFCLAVDYGWRISVHYTSDVGSDWTREMHVHGVEHKIGASTWTTTLKVDDAYAPPAQYWDDQRPGHGWDHALWDQVI